MIDLPTIVSLGIIALITWVGVRNSRPRPRR